MSYLPCVRRASFFETDSSMKIRQFYIFVSPFSPSSYSEIVRLYIYAVSFYRRQFIEAKSVYISSRIMDCHVGVISIQFNIAHSGTYRECMRIFSYTLGLINKHYAKNIDIFRE